MARILRPFQGGTSGPAARISRCRRLNAASSSFSLASQAVDAAGGSSCGSATPAAAQDLAGARAERHHIDAFARLSPAGGLPDALPVGGAVTRGPEPGLVDEGLAEDRPVPVDALPVVREPPRRHGQRRGGQVLRPHPWKHQKAGVDHHQAPPAVACPVRPSDPAVPAREPLRHRIEQQAPQPAPLPVGDEAADMRPEGAPVAEVVVAVGESVPQLPPPGVGDGLDAKRTQAGQRRRDLRLRVRGGGPGRRVDGLHVADAVLPLRRQRQDAVALQRLQHPEAGPDLAGPLRRLPSEMLADGLRKFVAAVVREHLDGLLDVGDLPPVQAAAREGGRLEVDDPLVHGRFPHLPDHSMQIAGRLSRGAEKKIFPRRKSRHINALQAAEKITPWPQIYPNAIGRPPPPIPKLHKSDIDAQFGIQNSAREPVRPTITPLKPYSNCHGR